MGAIFVKIASMKSTTFKDLKIGGLLYIVNPLPLMASNSSSPVVQSAEITGIEEHYNYNLEYRVIEYIVPGQYRINKRAKLVVPKTASKVITKTLPPIPVYSDLGLLQDETSLPYSHHVSATPTDPLAGEKARLSRGEKAALDHFQKANKIEDDNK